MCRSLRARFISSLVILAVSSAPSVAFGELCPNFILAGLRKVLEKPHESRISPPISVATETAAAPPSTAVEKAAPPPPSTQAERSPAAAKPPSPLQLFLDESPEKPAAAPGQGSAPHEVISAESLTEHLTDIEGEIAELRKELFRGRPSAEQSLADRELAECEGEMNRIFDQLSDSSQPLEASRAAIDDLNERLKQVRAALRSRQMEGAARPAETAPQSASIESTEGFAQIKPMKPYAIRVSENRRMEVRFTEDALQQVQNPKVPKEVRTAFFQALKNGVVGGEGARAPAFLAVDDVSRRRRTTPKHPPRTLRTRWSPSGPESKTPCAEPATRSRPATARVPSFASMPNATGPRWRRTPFEASEMARDRRRLPAPQPYRRRNTDARARARDEQDNCAATSQLVGRDRAMRFYCSSSRRLRRDGRATPAAATGGCDDGGSLAWSPSASSWVWASVSSSSSSSWPSSSSSSTSSSSSASAAISTRRLLAPLDAAGFAAALPGRLREAGVPFAPEAGMTRLSAVRDRCSSRTPRARFCERAAATPRP